MGTTMVGGTLIRKMLEAAGMMNTDTTREEKTEMKEYKCKAELSKEYTITAANPTEARNKAAELFMAEATDDTPHELTPLIQIAEVGTEEDDLDWEYEEETSYELYYKDGTGYTSNNYETIDDMLEDISTRYRLTLDEENEREDNIINLLERDVDDLDVIDYDLPFVSLEVWRMAAD